MSAQDSSGSSIAAGKRPGERAETSTISILVWIPLLTWVIFATVNVGDVFLARMAIKDEARTAAREAAAAGGNNNPRLSIRDGPVDVYYTALLRASCGQAAVARCDRTGAPDVSCTPDIAAHTGDPITCTVRWNYYPPSGDLLRGPLGLGIGSALQPFSQTVTVAAEVGELDP